MSDNHLSAKIGQYAIIKNDDGKILILERMRSKTWCLPGGRLNENEEWDTALLRELKEELNLECQNPNPIAVNVIKDDYQIKYCVYFQVDCTNLSEIIISDEHSNLGWFKLDEIINLDIEDEQIKKVIIDYLS